MDRRLNVLWIVLLVAAPSVIIWLIAVYGVNVPVWDQIPVGQFLVRNHDRLFPRIADLFAQHNESRKFFPRLIFFYLARLTHWNVKAEMAVSFLLACGVLANVAILARKNLVTTALASLLIFSPVQWWNWLFGIQVVVFIPILMLMASLVVLQRPWPLWLRVTTMAVASFVATFSYANGMLLWIVLLVPLWFVAEKRIRVYTFWIAAAAATAILYFHDYQKPPGSPAFVSPLSHPMSFLAYILVFLGEPLSWSRGNALVAMVAGAVVLIIFVVTVAIVVRRRDRSAATPIAIVLYAIFSAGAAAIGRLNWSLPQATSPRYTTFSIYLPVALILLCSTAAARKIRITAAVALVVAHVFAVASAWPEMLFNHRGRLLARAAVQWALVSPDRSAFAELIWPSTDEAVATIAALSRIGYISPPAVRSDLVTQLRRDETPRYGAIERAGWIEKGAIGISGWASLPGPRVADAVLVTRAAADGEHVVAMSVRTALDHPGELAHAGWFAWLAASRIPAGATLHAWSYDSSNETVYRLGGDVRASR